MDKPICNPEDEKTICQHCNGDGWYVAPNTNTGDAEQIQCEACLGEGKI